MSKGILYTDVLDFDSPDLNRLVVRGRHLLRVNDTLMCAEVGAEHSLYAAGAEDCLKVAMVHIAYGYMHQDADMLGLAMAALEVALGVSAGEDCGADDLAWRRLFAAKLETAMRGATEEERQALMALKKLLCGESDTD